MNGVMTVTVNCVTGSISNSNTVFYLIAQDELFHTHVFECQGEGDFVAVTLLLEIG